MTSRRFRTRILTPYPSATTTPEWASSSGVNEVASLRIGSTPSCAALPGPVARSRGASFAGLDHGGALFPRNRPQKQQHPTLSLHGDVPAAATRVVLRGESVGCSPRSTDPSFAVVGCVLPCGAFPPWRGRRARSPRWLDGAWLLIQLPLHHVVTTSSATRPHGWWILSDRDQRFAERLGNEWTHRDVRLDEDLVTARQHRERTSGCREALLA